MDYYKVKLLSVNIPYIVTLHSGMDRASTIREYLLPAVKEANCAGWLEANEIELDYSVDTVTEPYSVVINIHARMDRRQYQEYALRFL